MIDLTDFYLYRSLLLLAVATVLLWIDIRRMRRSRARPYRITFAPFDELGDASLVPYVGEWRITLTAEESGALAARGESRLGHPIELRLAPGRYRVAATRHRAGPTRPARFVAGEALELARRTSEADSRIAVLLPLDDPAPDTLGEPSGVRVV